MFRPKDCENLDYELEVAAVVGNEGADVAESDALDQVAGFLLYNDWSARDIGRRGVKGPPGYHKSKDFAQGLGPWPATTDEFGDRLIDGRLDLNVQARANGGAWADSTTAEARYWSIPQLIARASMATSWSVRRNGWRRSVRWSESRREQA